MFDRRGAELPLQQPQLLVSAGAGQRLRDRAHPHHGAAGGRLRRERRAGARVPGDSRRQGSGAEPEDLPSSRRRSRCATSRSSSAASRGPRPRRSAFRRRRRATRRHRPGPVYSSLNLSVEANPRQVQRGREIAARAADIALFYESLVGDSPYSSFTVALVESDLPGGHSPGYFAMLNQPLPTSPLVWRNDPAAFSNYPDFFIAHELAHQWWGQAVGWRNYHEQWLSEGFAQYFAALYAQHQKGDEVVRRRAAAAAQVGHRLERPGAGVARLPPRPHPRREPRLPRARLQQGRGGAAHAPPPGRRRGVLPRAAALLSRRRASGRSAPRTSAPAMERETGRSLERFFQQWIYGSTIPQVKVGYRVDGADVVLRVEQIGEVFDVPVTVTLQYADRKSRSTCGAGHRAGRRAARAARRDPPRRRDQQGRRDAGGDRQGQLRRI